MSTPGSPPSGPERPAKRPSASAAVDARPLYATGGLAAATAAAIGLAVAVTLTVTAWVAAPHAGLGEEIGGVLRGAVVAWLVSHHVSFTVADAQISMLPIGLMLLPGLVLYRSGRWLARSCEIPRLRYVHRAALAIAGPYAAIAGTLALVARGETVEPSMPRALFMGFVIAFLAGGLGALRQLMADKGVAPRALLGLMPARSRSLLVGMLVSTGTLLLGGLVLFAVAFAVGFPEAVETTRLLAPGLVGGALLIVIQLAYLPNAVLFAVCYGLGPGFALGEATAVAPTGISTGPLPLLPLLAALPEDGAAPVASLAALAVPFVAGAVGGVLTQRSAPDLVSEAAPLWGFVCGVTTGALCAALGELAGGSLGMERLSDIGPSAWQVGLVAALEVGAAAAIAAWGANWYYTRRRSGGAEPDAAPEAEARPAAELPVDVPVGEGLATVTPLRPHGEKEEAPGPEDRGGFRPGGPALGGGAEKEARGQAVPKAREERAARRQAAREERARRRAERKALRADRPRRWRRRDAEDSDELYGITYEAEPEEADAPRN
ncbi:DUF6350 family protein [Nocardiopsis algeriensis]|uniref:Succinate dehydrogenase/fumarate reductase cytochrome b subunit n=1 Tax=Nocardiopsis algeriensis TaxID=1478215 RepID=A0A841IVH1_9ACTN|nr:succinate dehydrogenase/fumarate reductase cytochrome b subunit [Nocardiopsis algeriensis]